jgi:DNA-binding response OmpR family regulator
MSISNKAKILVIDDDKDTNNLFKIYLEYDGFQVDSYTYPVDVLYYFKKGKFDLILLDLKMPQIDGIEIFHALKKRDDKAIICLTTADIPYLEQLKEKIPNIEKYVIYKPILLRNLKDKINGLVLEKSDILLKYNIALGDYILFSLEILKNIGICPSTKTICSYLTTYNI